jgi:hypothetical protein
MPNNVFSDPICIITSLNSHFSHQLGSLLCHHSFYLYPIDQKIPSNISAELSSRVIIDSLDNLLNNYQNNLYAVLLHPQLFFSQPPIHNQHFSKVAVSLNQKINKGLFLTSFYWTDEYFNKNFFSTLTNFQHISLKDSIDLDISSNLSPINTAIRLVISQGEISQTISSNEKVSPFLLKDSLPAIIELLLGYPMESSKIIVTAPQKYLAINLTLTIKEVYYQLFSRHLKINSSNTSDLSILAPSDSVEFTVKNATPFSQFLPELLANATSIPPSSISVNKSSSKEKVSIPTPESTSNRQTNKLFSRKIKILSLVTLCTLFSLVLSMIIPFQILHAISTQSSTTSTFFKNQSSILKIAAMSNNASMHLISSLSPTLNHISPSISGQLASIVNNDYLNIRSNEEHFYIKELLENIYTQSFDPKLTSPGILLPQLIARLENYISLKHQMALLSPNATIQKITLGNTSAFLLLRQLLPIYSQIISSSSQSHILIIHQNHLKLKPSGGEINYLTLITLEQGRVISAEVKSVSQLDQELLGFVEPPLDLRQLLGKDRWYLKDANWSPDFSQSAAKIAWFYQKETGIMPDLIVGLTHQGLGQILGSSSVKSSNSEEINQSNLGLKLFENFNNLGNSSTSLEKELIESFINKSKNLRRDQVGEWYQGIYEAIIAGQMQIYSSNPENQDLLEDLNLAGSIKPQSCFSKDNETCFSESLVVNQTNMAENSVNLFTSTKQSHTLTLTSQEYLHQHQVLITNTAPITSFPGGTYQTYLRFILPSQSVDYQLSINNQSVPKSDQIITQIQNQPIIGIIINTKVGDSSQLDLTYTTIPPEKPPLSYHQYQINFIKQPGVISSPIQFNLNNESPLVLSENYLSSSSHFNREVFRVALSALP